MAVAVLVAAGIFGPAFPVRGATENAPRHNRLPLMLNARDIRTNIDSAQPATAFTTKEGVIVGSELPEALTTPVLLAGFLIFFLLLPVAGRFLSNDPKTNYHHEKA